MDFVIVITGKSYTEVKIIGENNMSLLQEIIKREIEFNLPRFTNHEDSKTYFQETYGEQFVEGDSEVINGKRIYYYKLILNKATYIQGLKELKENGSVSDMFFSLSYQSIEIRENGTVYLFDN